MQILIDYENVGTPGLNGTQYLCKSDRVTLFYSRSCTHIKKKHIEDIEQRTECFEAVKLISTGKNGLDFYIAVRVGQIIERNNDRKILIVTGDSGYQAIRDFCLNYTNSGCKVYVYKDIESGIMSIDSNTERKTADGVSVVCMVLKGKVAAMFDSIGGAVQFVHQRRIVEEIETNRLKEVTAWLKSR